MNKLTGVYNSIILGCLVLTVIPSTIFAQDSFEEFKKQYQNEYQAYKQTVETGIADNMDAYETYREQMQKEYEDFKEEMEQMWGDFQERTKKEWVEYKNNGKLKIHVDFETGEGQVAVIAENEEEAREARDQMKDMVYDAFTSKGTKQGFESDAFENQPATDQPVLDDQVTDSEDQSVEEKAGEVAENNTKEKQVKGKDGKTRTVVYANFALAPNHIQKRAKTVSGQVTQFSKKYGLDPSLVYAIIHTESYFNPTAVSPVKAYGLMQLVPTSGGRDAYRRVFSKDGIPTKEFLFKPENNVRLGCAYVEILTGRYFKNVDVSESREYLAIAAYNTGAGNVAKAFVGSTNLGKAMSVINANSPQENYDQLMKNLPYEETIHYLEKVTERREQYKQWAENE